MLVQIVKSKEHHSRLSLDWTKPFRFKAKKPTVKDFFTIRKMNLHSISRREQNSRNFNTDTLS